MIRVLCGKCGMPRTLEDSRGPCPRCGEDAVATLRAMKDAAARELARKHYEVDAGLVQVFHIKSSTEIESALSDPIKLLEVNENAVPNGVMPLYFGRTPTRSGISFPSIILEVTPREFKQIEAHELKLPDGWLHSELIPRSVPVEILTVVVTADRIIEFAATAVESTTVECTSTAKYTPVEYTATADEWAKAYARQAQADFKTWRVLQGEVNVAECHRLLFLHMACEKLCKAHLIRAGTTHDSLRPRLARVAGPLRTVIREYLLRQRYEPKDVAQILRHAKRMADDIELLNPAIDLYGQRPDNCEYPWVNRQHPVGSPLDWSFELSKHLVDPAGRTFMKVLSETIDAMVSELTEADKKNR